MANIIETDVILAIEKTNFYCIRKKHAVRSVLAKQHQLRMYTLHNTEHIITENSCYL